MITFYPRDGALRYQDEDGEWRCANPRDPMYSTVTMLATQYFKQGEWVNINEDDDAS